MTDRRCDGHLVAFPATQRNVQAAESSKHGNTSLIYLQSWRKASTQIGPAVRAEVHLNDPTTAVRS